MTIFTNPTKYDTWKSITWCLRTQDRPFPTPTVYAHTTHKHTQLLMEGMTRSRTSKHTQPTKPKHAEHQAKPAKACPSPRPFSKETIKLKSRRLYQDKPHQLHQTFHLNLVQPADSNVCALHRGHTHPGELQTETGADPESRELPTPIMPTLTHINHPRSMITFI